MESITKLSSYTDVKKENLYFVRQPPPITNAIQGNQVTFQCQIRGQKPIGKSKWDARDGWLFVSWIFNENVIQECKESLSELSVT